MRFKFLSLSAVVLACMTFMLVSCESFSLGLGSGRRHKPKHGPPPHAPAHGYRHKHQGVDFEGHYYRYHEPHWEVGVHIEGPWESVSEEALPPGLRAKGKGKGKSKEHPGRGLGLQKKDK